MSESKGVPAVWPLKLFAVAVVAGVALLMGLVLVARVSKEKAKAQRIRCTGNLKQIGLSFRIFETDHNGKYPMQLATNLGGTLEFGGAGQVFRHFQSISNELTTPLVLTCPADSRKPVAQYVPGQRPTTNFAALTDANISYFVGMDATPERHQALLSGDRNLTASGTPIQKGLFVLTTNSAVAWSSAMHKRAGNAALCDGSVPQLTSARLVEQVRTSGAPTNRLLFP